MSGKKASEVNQLLKNGKETRSGMIGMLDSSYISAVQSYQKMQNSVEKALGKTKVNLKLDKAMEEFPDASRELVAQFDALEKELQSFSDAYDVQSVQKAYNTLGAEFYAIDKESEKVSKNLQNKIRSQGRNDPWHCDDEYYAADKVARQYAQMKTKVNKLNAELNSITSEFSKTAAKSEKIAKLLEKIVSDSKALEVKAISVVELREDAKKAKQSASDDFNNLDKELANKFLPAEYKTLASQIETFMELSDKQAVEMITSMTSAINEYSIKLENKYSEYLKLLEATKAYLGSITDRINNKVFSDPMNDFKQGNYEKMELVTFLEKFCSGKYIEQINDLLEEANILIKREEFNQANERLDALRNVLDLASEYAAKTHECRKKTIENALAIRDTMLNLNYDVNTSIITTDDGSFGFDISCKAGDEEILFENVAVNQDGEFSFGIDHTESISGTCGSSWHNIRNGLAENGVYVKDITKNGNSVHAPNRATEAVRANDSQRLSGK